MTDVLRTYERERTRDRFRNDARHAKARKLANLLIREADRTGRDLVDLIVDVADLLPDQWSNLSDAAVGKPSSAETQAIVCKLIGATLRDRLTAPDPFERIEAA